MIVLSARDALVVKEETTELLSLMFKQMESLYHPPIHILGMIKHANLVSRQLLKSLVQAMYNQKASLNSKLTSTKVQFQSVLKLQAQLSCNINLESLMPIVELSSIMQLLLLGTVINTGS